MELVEQDLTDPYDSKLSFDFELDLLREDQKDPNYYSSESALTILSGHTFLCYIHHVYMVNTKLLVLVTFI